MLNWDNHKYIASDPTLRLNFTDSKILKQRKTYDHFKKDSAPLPTCTSHSFFLLFLRLTMFIDKCDVTLENTYNFE